MAILDQISLAQYLNRPCIQDYDPDYIASVINDAHASLSSYLQFDPVLQVVSGEEGTVELDSSGAYRGLYRMQTQVAPFVHGAASAIFSALTLTFARTVQVSINVNLYYAQVQHKNGRVWLSPAALSSLAGFGFDLGGPFFGQLTAVGYVADYAAGYATGIGDPTLPGSVSYGASPMPADITQAAVLLCRERLAMDDANNAQTTNAAAGNLISQRTADQAETYGGMSGGMSSFGYGTALSTAAANRLRRWQRTVIA